MELQNEKSGVVDRPTKEVWDPPKPPPIATVNVNDIFPINGLWCKVVQIIDEDKFVLQVTGPTKQTRKKYRS